jgi:oligopeptide transport system substrate-binding protein
MDLFEGLVVLHPEDLHPVQGVAVRYDKSADNRFFRFHLRPEAKWSDGKPVVAGDFVYAWRRVVTASTGARMATLMYPLKNGRLFHQGKLKATKAAIPLRAKPLASEGGRELSTGTALTILRTTPARATSGVVVTGIDDRPLTFDGSLTRAGKALSSSSKSAEAVDVTGTGPDVKCNGVPDRWYRVRHGDEEGWLPGCALEDDPKATWALVQTHGRPTFRPPSTSSVALDEGQGGGDGGGGEGGTGGGAQTEGGEGGARAHAADEAQAGPQPEPAPERGFVPLDQLVTDPSVVGVRATDDHTLEVELEEPTPYFLELCGYVTYYPVRKDVIERFEAKGRPDLWYRPENIVTNGAYVLTEHKFRYELTFERNPHYHHHDELRTHRIVWLEVPDYNATMNLYETGEIDYIGSNLSLPTAHMDRLSKYEDFDRSVWLATYWYEFNVDEKPVDDVRVRRALNLSVDKQLLIDKVTRGGQQPATHIIPDATGAGYAKLARTEGDPMGKDLFSGKGWDFDPDLARELLTEAGYPVKPEGDGFKAEGFPPLEILYNTSEGHRAIAVAIQDMWKRHLGISVQLRNEEWKVMLKNLRDGHFQIARFGWVADYNHPHTYLDTFLSYSNNNWTHWGDPRFDHLVEKAASTADPLESMRIYRQAEKRAMEAMPRMPLYFYTKSTLIKPYVKGYYPNAANRHKVQWMWIDPDWRSDRDNRPAYPPEELPSPGTIEASPAP